MNFKTVFLISFLLKYSLGNYYEDPVNYPKQSALPSFPNFHTLVERGKFLAYNKNAVKFEENFCPEGLEEYPLKTEDSFDIYKKVAGTDRVNIMNQKYFITLK